MTFVVHFLFRLDQLVIVPSGRVGQVLALHVNATGEHTVTVAMRIDLVTHVQDYPEHQLKAA